VPAPDPDVGLGTAQVDGHRRVADDRPHQVEIVLGPRPDRDAQTIGPGACDVDLAHRSIVRKTDGTKTPAR
jgi:hypothetical protein